jgi:ABC-type multidrug transport system fused ATPase/permease subunit
VRKRRKRFALAVACAVGYALMRLLEPWPLKLVLDSVLLERPLPPLLAPLLPDVQESKLALLGVLSVGIVIVGLTGGLLYYFHRLLAAALGQEISADLRLRLYEHVHRLSSAFHDRRRTGDLIVRLTSDIRLLREALVGLPLVLIEHSLLTVGMVVVMLMLDWPLALVALSLVPGLALLVRRYRRPMKRAIRQQRDREGHLATIAAERIGAVRLVQGFGREEHEVTRFGTLNKRSLRSGLKAARMEARFKWTTDFSVAVVMACIVAMATYRVLTGTLSPGDIIVFVTYVRIFARPVRRVSRTMERMLRSTSAGERVIEILETEPRIRDRPGARPAGTLRGEIDMDHVWFAHRGERWVLEDITLGIAPGERVALVGPTGSGKSTLASLLPRFYDATRGRVCIDGVDVRALTVASLRAQIALVFQEPLLFAATIEENIAYGKPGATSEEVRQAAERSGIARVIEQLPEGYDTVIGERGCTLSGGQRQCVAIARAIIRDAPIVILDEPTTGLDQHSANQVMTAVRKLMDGRTVILISHDMEWTRDADRVVVLDRGRIHETGTPATLLDSNGLYRHLNDAANS